MRGPTYYLLAITLRSACGIAFDTDGIVLLRIGDGTSPLPATQTVLTYLDEYVPIGGAVGSLRQSIPLESFLSTPYVSDGDAHGQLELSGDGKMLLVAGYKVPAGTASYTSSLNKRVIVKVGADGTVVEGSSWITAAGGTYRALAATSVDGSYYYLAAESGGVYYVPPGGENPSWVYLSTFKSVTVFSNRLYASKLAGTQMTFPDALPNTLQPQLDSVGTPIFADARGMAWTSALAFFVVDEGAGLYWMTRPSVTVSIWAKSGPWKAGSDGSVTQFHDCAVSKDGNTVYVVAPTGLYAYDMQAFGWLNGGEPLLAPNPNTQFKGIARSPINTGTPTATATGTATGSATATGTVGTVATATSTATASGTATTSFNFTSGGASASSSGRGADGAGLGRATVGEVAGGAAAGMLFLLASLFFYFQRVQFQRTEIRLRKLKASAASSQAAAGQGRGASLPPPLVLLPAKEPVPGKGASTAATAGTGGASMGANRTLLLETHAPSAAARAFRKDVAMNANGKSLNSVASWKGPSNTSTGRAAHAAQFLGPGPGSAV